MRGQQTPAMSQAVGTQFLAVSSSMQTHIDALKSSSARTS